MKQGRPTNRESRWTGSIKGNVKRKFFPKDGGVSLFSAFSPFRQDSCCLQCIVGAKKDVRLEYMLLCVELPRPLRNANKQNARSVCQPWFYLRLLA